MKVQPILFYQGYNQAFHVYGVHSTLYGIAHYDAKRGGCVFPFKDVDDFNKNVGDILNAASRFTHLPRPLPQIECAPDAEQCEVVEASPPPAEVPVVPVQPLSPAPVAESPANTPKPEEVPPPVAQEPSPEPVDASPPESPESAQSADQAPAKSDEQ